MQCGDVLARLRDMSNPAAVAGMARYGINPENTLGVSIPNIRSLARQIKKDHSLAQKLWATGIHEARILASMVADPKLVSQAQMDAWVNDFDSWDVCDQCCLNLFQKTDLAYEKTAEWSRAEPEFVKRAGFALMACLAVGDKKTGDDRFEEFFPLIEAESEDNRNYVRKAINWALRQIGKRNLKLNRQAIEVAGRIQARETRSARWIASDALRELTSQSVQERLQRKAG